MSLNDTARGFGRLSEAVGKDGKVDMLETGIILDFISRRCRRMPDTDGLVKMLNAVAERGFMTESDSASILDELQKTAFRIRVRSYIESALTLAATAGVITAVCVCAL